MTFRSRPWPWPCFVLQEIGNRELRHFMSLANPPAGTALYRDIERLKQESVLYSFDIDDTAERQSPRFGTSPSFDSFVPPLSVCSSDFESGDWNARYFGGDTRSFRLHQKEVLRAKNVGACGALQLRIVLDPLQMGYQDIDDNTIGEGSIVIDNYQIGSLIGQAAHSVVFVAKSLDSGAKVCVKVSLQCRDSVALSLAEIQALKLMAAACKCDEYMLEMLDFFFYRGRVFMVAELLGPNLYELYSGRATPNHDCGLIGRVSEGGGPSALSIEGISIAARSLLIALAKLQDLGLFHGDIKPENVLACCRNGKCSVKLIDFGSSHFICEDVNCYQQSRPYRAPEMALGLPYDTKADLWSLGAMLAELWVGRLLFPSDNNATLVSSIISLLGDIPQYMASASTVLLGDCSFFISDGCVIELYGSSAGRLARPQKSCLRTLLRLARPEGCGDQTLDEFHDLLTRLMALDPTKRPDPGALLDHPFVRAAP
ncbi:Protein kinase domain [Babesia microti strain RI]|uniref:Protein kinase domain n=1 Tax=Babesia microti (strain RI) TaxID=1133968 RepID=I7IFJ8_BABMR|nr:Protein kinase domain [Babesia microti strain RI]CCF72861.1 Protein kinase domain [Babesia microti strain RI]|eukprot:XP_012647470.1 Protein kinase domain [Babesia microti strain RI]